VAEVFTMAGIGMAVALVLVWLLIAKDKVEEMQETDFWHTIRNNNSISVLKHKEILPIFWFYFLYSMGLNAFYDFYPVWFVDYYHADGKTIALATTCLTLVMIIVSVLFVTKLQRKYGEIKVILAGATVLATLLFIQPFLGIYQAYVIFAMIGGIIALTNGMIPSFLSNYFGHLGLGKVMGLQTSTFCITNVIIAIVGGMIAILDSVYILLLGSFLVFGSVTVLWRNRKSQYKMMQEQSINLTKSNQ